MPYRTRYLIGRVRQVRRLGRWHRLSDLSEKGTPIRLPSKTMPAGISTREGATQLAPGRGTKCRRPVGSEAPHIPRPLWSHLHRLVRPQGSMMYTVPFSRWSSGFALDQGLAEWHPVGCSRGFSLDMVVLPTRGRGFWSPYLPPFIGSASLEWGLRPIGPP